MKRAFLILNKSNLHQEIKTILPLANYQVIASVQNSMEALRLIHRYEPDLIIIGWNINGISTSDLLRTLIEQHICPILTVLTPEDYHSISEVIKLNVHQLILYPLRAVDLVSAIISAEHKFEQESQQNQRIQKLEEEIISRKLIYQAIIILVKKYGFEEDYAYSIIRNQSMNSRKTLRAISKDIIKGMWLPEDVNENR